MKPALEVVQVIPVMVVAWAIGGATRQRKMQNVRCDFQGDYSQC